MSDGFLDLLDRPIAFQRSFVSLGVGITGALMLSQAIYWTKRSSNGWFYKTATEWQQETGMTRYEQERARKALKSIGVWHEKKQGIPSRLFYKVDSEALRMALMGNVKAVTLEECIDTYSTTLNSLSKAGMMRARKAGVFSKFVSYADVLKDKGMVCGCCGEQIKYGPGNYSEGLSFDHIIPLAKGGSHTKDNIQPAHTSCNSGKADKLNYRKETSLLSVNKQECLSESSSDVLEQQTITENTQRLPETTTDIIAGSGEPTKPSKKKPASKKVSLPEEFKPTAQHVELANKSGVDLQHEFEQFKDYHKAKDSKMVDWHAALRTWIRNAAKFAKSKPAAKSNRQGYLRQDLNDIDYSRGINEDGTF